MSEQPNIDTIDTVASVNADGTVNLWHGGGYVPNVPALDSYLERAVNDRVLVRVRNAQLLVVGRSGPPIEIPTAMNMTLSDSSAPSGEGWREIVSGQVWAKPGPPGALWMKHYVPYVPPPPTSTDPAVLSVGPYDVDTYRGGVRMYRGYAEQGDWSGHGLQTGVWVFPTNWWVPLTGKTIDGVYVDVGRRAAGHGFTYGPVEFTLWIHDAEGALPDATPGRSFNYAPGSLGLGQVAQFTLPRQWGESFRDDPSCMGIAIHSDYAGYNIECDYLLLHIHYH